MRLGLFTLTLCAVVCASGWKQDRFAISIWVDPVVPPEEFPARYAEMRRTRARARCCM